MILHRFLSSMIGAETVFFECTTNGPDLQALRADRERGLYVDAIH
jgi:hypothetical protein